MKGTGNFRTLQEAIESARAFMDYTVTIYVRNGVYKEKVIVPSWVENIDIIGEDRDKTIITYDDHANINKMGTFRTYTVKVEGSDITFKNLTIENNAAQLGQAVALHTEGDRLKFINCRILGNQDTIYTGAKFTRLYFKDCYIDGTTDFIFGPSTALFEDCIIHSKRNSYVTAASTPKEAKYGYVFKHCKLTAEPGVDKVYLGRPWRPYAYTLFIECELGHMEMSAAISKMTMSKSANCDKKTFRSPGLFPSSSIFSPHVSRIFCTCFSDNPCSVVENTSLSCSLEYFQYFFMACPPCVVVQKKKRDFFAPE